MYEREAFRDLLERLRATLILTLIGLWRQSVEFGFKIVPNASNSSVGTPISGTT